MGKKKRMLGPFSVVMLAMLNDMECMFTMETM